VCHDSAMLRLAKILIQLFADTLRLCGLAFRSSRSIKAENLFLRRQLALYVERSVKPRHIDPVTRIALALLSRFCNWRGAGAARIMNQDVRREFDLAQFAARPVA
jgi:hypothetical protein